MYPFAKLPTSRISSFTPGSAKGHFALFWPEVYASRDPEVTRHSPMTTKPPPVPPSLEERGGRSCANCACYFEQVDKNAAGLPVQGFCSRNPTTAYPYQTQRQKLDSAGQPMTLIPRKRTSGPIPDQPLPVMETVNEIAFLFLPMKADNWCHDGWRPKGTLPGERRIEAVLRMHAPLVRESLKRMGISPQDVAGLLLMLGVTPSEETTPPQAFNG